MTSLRQRMLEDMQVRNLSQQTQLTYVEQVSRFARHFGQSPERPGTEQIRAYQVYLIKDRKLAPSSLTVAVAALRFLYTASFRRGSRRSSFHSVWTSEPIAPVLAGIGERRRPIQIIGVVQPDRVDEANPARARKRGAGPRAPQRAKPWGPTGRPWQLSIRAPTEIQRFTGKPATRPRTGTLRTPTHAAGNTQPLDWRRTSDTRCQTGVCRLGLHT
jgi:hypothetical protein